MEMQLPLIGKLHLPSLAVGGGVMLLLLWLL